MLKLPSPAESRPGRSEQIGPQAPFPRRDNELRSLLSRGLTWPRIARAMDLPLDLIVQRAGRIGLR